MVSNNSAPIRVFLAQPHELSAFGRAKVLGKLNIAQVSQSIRMTEGQFYTKPTTRL
jgi:hypothetical protein